MEVVKSYSSKHMLLLFLAAFLFRSLVFYYYIFPHYRYNQPDTKDYHVCAISLAQGRGMAYYNSDRPIFWRTPGYPLLLAPFYKYFGTDQIQLIHYRDAHWIFLWLQILICSLLPIIVFSLAMLLTKNSMLSWLAALITTFHLGFTLSSTYLMTDGLTCIFFLLFLYFFYFSLSFPYEEKSEKSESIRNIIIAAVSLSMCTWLRPMGIYISMLSSFLILTSTFSWQKKAQTLLLFLTIFFGSLSPWYLRNYMLTGSAFFCPLWGPYTLTFLVPKIYQRLHKHEIPLTSCITKFLKEAHYASQHDIEEKKQAQSPYTSCKELICAQIANPWLKSHPGYFLLDWSIEVFKTTCDLYSGHLVNFLRNNFATEPPVEFLSEKLKDCLYKQKMSFLMRIICWIEAIFHLSILFALCGGTLRFIFSPLFQLPRKAEEEKKRLTLWVKTGLFIALVIVMTGGFGYARLRLPVEALMIILALDFYHWLFLKRAEAKSNMARKNTASA